MRPLLIGREERDALARVRAHAEAHFFTLGAVLDAVDAGRLLAMDPGFRCVLRFGFRVAFTIEEHPAGWARHLSVSLVDAPLGIMPGSHALRLIGRELGMPLLPSNRSIVSYLEGDPPFAVSIIEPIERPG